MLCVAGAGGVPRWVPAQGWAQASQGEISAHVWTWDLSHRARALGTICWQPTSCSSFQQLNSWHRWGSQCPWHCRGLGHRAEGEPLSPITPNWDIGWVTPVPASLPDRGAPACPRSHLRGDGAWQRDFGFRTMLHMMGSFCLVRGRHHICSHTAPCPQMPDEECQGKRQLISK